jgi:hypothetical protein
MAQNGISTLATKASRRAAKIALAESKRQAVGTRGYRLYNFYIGTVSPTPNHPWSQFRPAPHDAEFLTENGEFYLETEDGLQLTTE